MHDNLLIVFVKNPVLGQVKTRLAADIGDEKALAVYFKLLHHTREVAGAVDADKAVFYDTYVDTEDDWQEGHYRKSLQEGNDLGERMYHALRKGEGWGYKNIVLIGSDCYELTSDIIDHAFRRLQYHDWVFGPSKDGGYYLIGCRKPLMELFELKAWSHDLVLSETLEKAYQLELSVSLIEELNDIDTLEDLKNSSLGKIL